MKLRIPQKPSIMVIDTKIAMSISFNDRIEKDYSKVSESYLHMVEDNSIRFDKSLTSGIQTLLVDLICHIRKPYEMT